MAVPYTFATATSAIPLSNLDSNFATAITLGNTAVYLGNTTTSFGNVTLTNATISSLSTPITVAQGGTGLVTITSNGLMVGNGTGNVTIISAGTTGNVLTSNGTAWLSTASTTQVYPGAGIANSTGTAWGTSYTTNGSGTVVALITSPTLVTPTIGVATATSVNKVSITTPATSATLTLADGSTLVTSGAYSTTLTVTGTTTVTLPTTGTLATLAGSETLSNKTLTTPILGTPTSGNLSTCTADGTNAVGYRNIPLSGTKTASYTLVAGDVGKFVILGTSGLVVIPASVFSIGDAISVVNNTTAAITCTSSAVSAYLSGTNTLVTSFILATRGVCTILFVTASVVFISGNVT